VLIRRKRVKSAGRRGLPRLTSCKVVFYFHILLGSHAKKSRDAVAVRIPVGEAAGAWRTRLVYISHDGRAGRWGNSVTKKQQIVTEEWRQIQRQRFYRLTRTRGFEKWGVPWWSIRTKAVDKYRMAVAAEINRSTKMSQISLAAMAARTLKVSAYHVNVSQVNIVASSLGQLRWCYQRVRGVNFSS
jgi:hypothetical protein